MIAHDEFSALENLNDPATAAFAREAHESTLAQFGDEAYHALKDDIAAMLRDEKQIPFCQEHRAKMYHFHQSAAHPKGVYRVCSSASYRAGIPDWQVLFDVADFDALLGDDVYLDGVSHCVEQPERALLTLSAAGGDAAYTLEFDLAARALVENGFHFPAAKSHIAWRDADSLWVCPAWDEEQLTESGYPREVWLMRRGQVFEDAQLVFRMDAQGVMVHAWRYLDGQGAAVDLLEAATGFFSKTYYRIAADGSVQALNLPQDAEICGYLAGQLLVRLKTAWQRANRRYAAGALLAVRLDKYGTGAAQQLFVPDAGQAVETVETTKRFVVVSVLDNVAGRLMAWRWHNGEWLPQDVPQLDGGAVEMTDQPWGGDVLYLASSSFLSPLTLYALDLNVMELCVLRRQPQQFDPAGMTVVQHHAQSADGTRIPYYRVGAAAPAPTLVYAYGGFDVAELPHYLGSIGKHWLAQGGAFVLANIRGGGEFAGWHAAAVRENKHKSVEDLLAVAEDLYARGLALPEHTALQGGSNGGLVCAAAYVRAPQRIGALVCEVPLTDMLRYHRLSAGASWLEEYGNPDNEPDYRYLAALSPYHNLNPDTAYPPALITTSLSDDRVHPAHALKFYAKLRQTRQPQTWLYAPDSGGHTGNGTQDDTAAELACVLRFLNRYIVPNPI